MNDIDNDFQYELDLLVGNCAFFHCKRSASAAVLLSHEWRAIMMVKTDTKTGFNVFLLHLRVSHLAYHPPLRVFIMLTASDCPVHSCPTCGQCLKNEKKLINHVQSGVCSPRQTCPVQGCKKKSREMHFPGLQSVRLAPGCTS